jgi:Lon protease-like protein
MPSPRRIRSIVDLPPVIPVFPLTGVILLPRARLPLNIFEPRYLAMIDAALAGSRLIGMVQPKAAGEDMAAKPELRDIGCVGRIVEFSESEDGRYLITLAGIARFKLREEFDVSTPFRQVAADYGPYARDFDTDVSEDIARERLLTALKPYLDEREMRTDWKSVMEAPAETLVNALCMLCPFGPSEKQALMEANGLRERAETLTALIEMANAGPAGSGGSQPVH